MKKVFMTLAIAAMCVFAVSCGNNNAKQAEGEAEVAAVEAADSCCGNCENSESCSGNCEKADSCGQCAGCAEKAAE